MSNMDKFTVRYLPEAPYFLLKNESSGRPETFSAKKLRLTRSGRLLTIPTKFCEQKKYSDKVHQRAGTEWKSGGNVSGEKSLGEVLPNQQ